jgi:hypothetical protein
MWVIINKNKQCRVLILAFFLLVLNACSQETDIILKSGEHWDFETKISLNLALLPGIGGSFEGASIKLDTGAITASTFEIGFEQLVHTLRKQGIQASWNTNHGRGLSETVYTVNASGQGWELFTSLFQFDPSMFGNLEGYEAQALQYQVEVTNVGNDQIHFIFYFPEVDPSTYMLFPTTYRIHGGKIISSNADIVEGGVAPWINPQPPIEVVLTPASSFSSIGTLLLCLIGIVILFGVIFAISKKKGTNRNDLEYGSIDWG